MFYLFDMIKKPYIFEQIVRNDLEEDLKINAIKDLVSFSITHGITGNLYKKYILYTLIYNENPYTLSIELNQKTIGETSLVKLDLEKYYNIYNKDKEFSEVLDFNFSKSDKPYLSILVDDLYNKIEKNLTFDNFYNAILDFYKTKGVGNMAVYSAFRVKDGILKPIKNVSSIRFSDIIGYDMQKDLLKENTLNFINNKSYNNVLLYGDAGTGKSSSIKALLNEYFDKGLRIIEVYKHQMKEIAKIINTLKNRPYHYIIYMDDLSFDEDEVEYKYLKSVIEGGIEPKPSNVCIYATSNRRHLIKESVADNGNVFDDLHRGETQAEKLSLSYRFGLQIFYSSLSVEAFKEMVLQMAKKNKIKYDEDKLIKEALAWQMRNGTLSGRVAEQFIKYISNK